MPDPSANVGQSLPGRGFFLLAYGELFISPPTTGEISAPNNIFKVYMCHRGSKLTFIKNEGRSIFEANSTIVIIFSAAVFETGMASLTSRFIIIPGFAGSKDRICSSRFFIFGSVATAVILGTAVGSVARLGRTLVITPAACPCSGGTGLFYETARSTNPCPLT